MGPKVVVESIAMEDPTFDSGVPKTAKAILTNPTGKELTYSVELYLGANKAATSGVGQVTIPAGASLEVLFHMVMPSIEGEYIPFLDVWHEGVLLKHYQATESVIISIIPDIGVGPITWV